MKKVFSALAALVLTLCLGVSVMAADGNVTYSGDSGKFIFAPGSQYSPTDLFPEFKGVMPGDVLTQNITVKNDASNKVKVKIYMRSLGAHADSKDFLSKLGLTVAVAEDNEMAYMFDATADQTAQLTDWVCLGTLYSGGEVDLEVLLHMPVELDNAYSSQIGYLDWEFMVEEFPVEDGDPRPPQTGDTSTVLPWIITFAASAVILLILIIVVKRKTKDEK